MVENIESILHVVTFIAVGGLVAIVFFFIFAQIITGSKSIHKQLNRLIRLNEEILNQLRNLEQSRSKTQDPKTETKQVPKKE